MIKINSKTSNNRVLKLIKKCLIIAFWMINKLYPQKCHYRYVSLVLSGSKKMTDLFRLYGKKEGITSYLPGLSVIFYLFFGGSYFPFRLGIFHSWGSCLPLEPQCWWWKIGVAKKVNLQILTGWFSTFSTERGAYEKCRFLSLSTFHEEVDSGRFSGRQLYTFLMSSQ